MFRAWAMVVCPAWHLGAWVMGLGRIPETYRFLFGGAGFALSFVAGTVAAWSFLVGHAVGQGDAGAIGKARALLWGTLALDGMLAVALVPIEVLEQLLASHEISVEGSAAIALPFLLVLAIPVAWIAHFGCSVDVAEGEPEESVDSRDDSSLPDPAMLPQAGAHVPLRAEDDASASGRPLRAVEASRGATRARRPQDRRLCWRATLLPIAGLVALTAGDSLRQRAAPQDRESYCLHELEELRGWRTALAVAAVPAAGFLGLLLLQWLVGR